MVVVEAFAISGISADGQPLLPLVFVHLGAACPVLDLDSVKITPR